MFKKVILLILVTSLWISLSEFVRNEYFLKHLWTGHYENMGLTFPSEPVNGMIWGLWSLLFAIAIYLISRKFSMTHTFLLSWFVGFVLMWVVTANMGVLPMEILVYAIPLSLLEAFIATYLIFKISGTKTQY